MGTNVEAWARFSYPVSSVTNKELGEVVIITENYRNLPKSTEKLPKTKLPKTNPNPKSNPNSKL